MSTPDKYDILVVQRGATPYRVPFSRLPDVADADLLLVQRGAAKHQVTGADLKAYLAGAEPPPVEPRLWTPLDSPLVSTWIDVSDPQAITLGSANRVTEVRGKGPRPLVLGNSMVWQQPALKETTGIGYVDGDNPGTNGLLSTETMAPPGQRVWAIFSVVSFDREFDFSRSFMWGGRSGGNSLFTSRPVATAPGWRTSLNRSGFVDEHLSRTRVNGVATDPALSGAGVGVVTTDFHFAYGDSNLAPLNPTLMSLANDPLLSSRYFRGSCYQCVVCTDPAVLSDTGLPLLLEGWAAHKYGQQALLPANHPYRNAPPLKS
jgi:hypothetical protein